jgi:hypothetical protein
MDGLTIENVAEYLRHRIPDGWEIGLDAGADDCRMVFNRDRNEELDGLHLWVGESDETPHPLAPYEWLAYVNDDYGTVPFIREGLTTFDDVRSAIDGAIAELVRRVP